MNKESNKLISFLDIKFCNVNSKVSWIDKKLNNIEEIFYIKVDISRKN